MLFSSTAYFSFFAAYFVVHALLPERFRLLLIIVGSAVFYSYWKVEYAWVPYLLTAIAYFGAVWMDTAADEVSRKRRLIVTISALLIPLAIFKYTNFVYSDVIGWAFSFEGKLVDWSLPLGISFVTFTLIAYVVDAFKRRFAVERRLQMLVAYATFFPHLIAGPILRPHELIPQLDRARRVFSVRFTAGIAIFSVGLVKKLVFADQIAITVDRVFGTPAGHSALDYLLAIYGFSMQIYNDFSGYTDMAIGSAILIGVRLPNNFNMPYSAVSIVDFWRRWHITLSHWLRDYLYIPMGGNRHGLPRQVLAILITMALGGLWHGASWTFVIWGNIHGVAVAIAHLVPRDFWHRYVPRWLGLLATFHVVTIAWIFFRAPDMETVWRVMAGPFTVGLGDPLAFLRTSAFPLLLMAVFLLLHRFDDHRLIRLATRRLPVALIWPGIVLAWILAITISAGSSASFIYFDF